MKALLRVRVGQNSLKGLARLAEDLRKARYALANPERAMRRYKQYQVGRWILNFTQEGTVYGRKWAPLSQWAIDERGSTHPILRRTGTLFDNVVDQSNDGELVNDGLHWHFINQGEERGDAFPLTHQFGMNPNPLDFDLDGRPGPIPARPIWDLDDEDADQALHYVADDASRALRDVLG